MYFQKKSKKKRRPHCHGSQTSVRNVLCVGWKSFSWSNFHFFYFVLFFSFILRAQRGVGQEEDEEAKDMKLYRTPVLSWAALAPRAHRCVAGCVDIALRGRDTTTTTFKARRGLRFVGRHRLSGKRTGEIWRLPNGRTRRIPPPGCASYNQNASIPFEYECQNRVRLFYFYNINIYLDRIQSL